jgi:glycine/D-amino acid oxidase-like deaminating enzyme
MDRLPLQFVMLVFAGWVNRHQQAAIEYLREESRVLREQLGGGRLRFSDVQRQRLARHAQPIGRRGLAELGTLVTPDTLLRWYRELVARKYDGSKKRGPGRPRTSEESPVEEITAGTTVGVRTPRGTVRTPVLVMATNAYTHHLGFLRGRILPVHCFSIASAPLTEAQIAALSWSGRHSLHDVRSFFDLCRLTADNRILLSGGDAFYCYGGAAVDEEGHRDYGRLERLFRRLFPALADVRVTHRWAGHVGVPLDMVPTIGALGPAHNVFFAGGYAGHGVSVAVLAGRLLRDLVAGEPLDPVYDFILDRKPPRAPGEPLTSLGLGLAKRYMRWDDAR